MPQSGKWCGVCGSIWRLSYKIHTFLSYKKLTKITQNYARSLLVPSNLLLLCCHTTLLNFFWQTWRTQYTITYKAIFWLLVQLWATKSLESLNDESHDHVFMKRPKTWTCWKITCLAGFSFQSRLGSMYFVSILTQSCYIEVHKLFIVKALIPYIGRNSFSVKY